MRKLLLRKTTSQLRIKICGSKVKMNDPSQYLVHLTNRGSEVAAEDGFVGDFKVFMKQPIKDVNRFGLLQYSIPKQLDIVNQTNNRFFLRFGYANGDEILVPVYLPLMDYYNMTISQESDQSGKQGVDSQRKRSKTRCSFDEVLQCTINWAIVKHADFIAPQGRISDDLFTRISCVVEFNQNTGTYEFSFGYRGNRIIQDGGLPTQAYAGDVQAHTGCPATARATQGIAAQPDGAYTFRRTTGQVQVSQGVVAGTDISNFQLTSVTFEDVPIRLQFLLGMPTSDMIFTDTSDVGDTVERGRIVVCNYSLTPSVGTGLVTCKMKLVPNLDPPSVLYLQLSVPGTRSKILGQADERGGWAIPTSSSDYVSRFMNMPNLEKYSQFQVRSMPALSAANFNTIWAPGDGQNPPNEIGETGSGYNFDPMPIGDPVGGVRESDNFALVGPNKSRLIIFGGTDIRNPQAPCVKFPRSMFATGEGPDKSFGCGYERDSPTFTTSLVQPQYIFTSTENSTIQTFDVKLLYGDTSGKVIAVTGHPVQFSLIASP